MKKEMHELSPQAQAEIRALEAMSDDEIDTSDIPEITDWTGAVRGKFYRPVKQQITLRIDADVIAWFRAQTPEGRGYQTNINRALREHVQRSARTAR